MRELLPEKLVNLAKSCPKPLYLVGGSVRDYLARLTPSIHDWDVCSPLSAEEFSKIAEANGHFVQAVYRNTGTVKFSDGAHDYEYASFRSDIYVRGTHVPVETFFTEDIRLDAKRRDFTANAVYYDIAREEFQDPLGGIQAIRERRLTTVGDAEKVFGEDGLRLMRLARQGAQLGFEPDEDCLRGATENARLIEDISPERIFAELVAILTADQKCGVVGAPYHGLQLLEKTGVLAYILPELTLGKGMAQRADFHKYDVLEHSLRAVKYAEKESADYVVRLAALLHDVGKPFCTLRDGNSFAHPKEGARIAREILLRLKAPKKVVERIPALVEWHMYDLDCRTNEHKLRRFFVAHYDIIDDLIKIKQSDFSACMDDTSKAPTARRWEEILAKMKAEGAPLTLKELALSGRDLSNLDVPQNRYSSLLEKLLFHACCNPQDNQKDRLLKLAKGFANSL